MPDERLRRQGPWHLRSLVRQTLATQAINRRVATCCRQYPTGLVPNVPKGKVPSPSQSLARSVAQEVVRPPSAVRRLDRSDGHRVTDHSRSHRTDRGEHATVAVEPLLGRMVPPTMPQGCTRIRYDGGQAPQTLATVKGVRREALAQGEGVVQGAVTSIARLPSRQRDQPSTGRDPLRGPHGRGEMGVWRLWPPTDGVLYDEGEGITRGTYASTVQRAGP